MHGLYFLFILCAVIISPASQTEAARAMARRSAVTFRYVAVIFMFLAAASFVWSQKNTLFPQNTSETPVNIAAFSDADLNGALREAVVTGVLQLDHIAFITFLRGHALLSGAESLVPLTGAGWQPGDPVKAFMAFRLFTKTMTAQDRRDALAYEALPVTSAGAITVSRLMAKAELFSFKGNAAQVLRAAGLDVSDPVYILEFTDTRRAERIKKAFFGLRIVAFLSAGIAGFFMLLGFGLKWAMARYDNRPVG